MREQPNPAADASFEREKLQQETQLREREIAVLETEAAIKQSEHQLKASELAFNQKEAARSKWTSPLVVAVFAAAIAALGNAIVAYINGYAQRQAEETKSTAQQRIEQSKADSALILEVIKTNNDPDKATQNLRFLVTTGLITDHDRRDELTKYLNNLKPGQGPTLPNVVAAQPPSSLPSFTVMRCSLNSTVDMAKLRTALETDFKSAANVQLTASESPGEITLVAADRTGLSLTMVIQKHNDAATFVAAINYPPPVVQMILLPTLNRIVSTLNAVAGPTRCQPT